MIVLDTDHVVALKYTDSRQSAALSDRLIASSDQDIATTVVTIEEQMRGWLALINRSADVGSHIPAYERLVDLFTFFARWKIVPFDGSAAAEFKRLRKQGIRIGTMDLKIAAVALVRDALPLSSNRRDFDRVPDLRVENWLI